MRRAFFLVIWFFCFMWVWGVPFAGAFSGLSDLARLKEGRPMRASSTDPRNWQDGNADSRPIPPGETLVLGELDGPGTITHIWFTIWAEDRHFPRTTTFRIYWDGREEPGVEAPLGDFFAVGHGLTRLVNSYPVSVASDGRAYNCFWPMPFRKSARLTMTNDSDRPVKAFFWYVDYIQLDEFPEDSAYFHAQYRQEYPCEKGDYLICDTEGRGHYVGTVLSVQMGMQGWFGEGDDRFYIDGEAIPSIQGTGTEDYFSDAWGFREFSHLFHGVTLWEGMQEGDRGTAYRWHIQDPIPFHESLRLTIEHKGPIYNASGEVVNWFAERPDYFSSVAFWYQQGEPKRFAEIPPVSERFLPEVYIEAEDLIESGTFTPRDAIRTQELGNCSGGKQLFFMARTRDATASIVFQVSEDARYILGIDAVHSWDYGIYDIFLNGRPLTRSLDFYNPSVITRSHSLGPHDLKAGDYVLTFAGVGANPDSRIIGTPDAGHFLGIDGIWLRKLKREGP